MRILFITGMAIVLAGCQKSTQPKLPSAMEMRPETAAPSSDTAYTPPTNDATRPANSEKVTVLKPLSSSEAEDGKMDERTILALLDDAAAAQKADDSPTAIALVRKVVRSGIAENDHLIQCAQILVKSKDVSNGVKLIRKVIENGRTETKLQLMLVSALRLQANENPDLRIESIQEAGKVVRKLQSSGELAPYGNRGFKLFLEVLATEASMCAQNGKHGHAITALSDIAEAGIPQFEQLTQSPAYDPIREMPEFIELVSRHHASLRSRLQVGARDLIAKHTAYPFEFNLRDVNGKRVTSADFPGKILVVDFWGTWCPPCRMETPELVRLQESFPHEVAVVGIAYEQGPEKTWKEKVQTYAETHNVNYSSLIGDARTKRAVKGGGLKSFPTLLFVDRNGKVRLQVTGYHDFARLDAVVSLLLTEN